MTSVRLEATLAEYTRGLEMAPDDLWARRKVATLLRKLRRRDAYLQEVRTLARMLAEQGDDLQLIGMLRLLLSEDPGAHLPGELCDALLQQTGSAELQPGLMEPRISHQLTTPLFSLLSPRNLAAMLERLRLVKLPADTLFIVEGQPVTAMLLLIEGSVGILRRESDGSDCLVETVEEGALLGEMEYLADAPAFSTCSVIEDSLMLELPNAFVTEMASRNQRFRRSLETIYQQRLLANVQRKVPQLRSLSEEARKLLLQRMHLHTGVDGDVFYDPAQHDEHLHLLVRGSAAQIGSDTVVTEGGWVGNMSGLVPRLVHRPLRVTKPSCWLTVDRTTVSQVMRPHPALLQEVERRTVHCAAPALGQAEAPASPVEASLYETLQAIAAGDASGELLAVLPDCEVHILFELGRIAWATASDRPSPLPQVLMDQANVELEVLREVVNDCRIKKRSLASALTSLGLASVQQLSIAIRAQCLDVVTVVRALEHPVPSLFVPRAHQRVEHIAELTFALSDLVVA